MSYYLRIATSITLCLKCCMKTYNLFLLFTEMNNSFNSEPKFSSECFFLTIHSHHIVLQPWLMAYKRRFKELRQIKRVRELRMVYMIIYIHLFL